MLKELSLVGRKISKPVTTIPPEPQGKGPSRTTLEVRKGSPEKAVAEEKGGRGVGIPILEFGPGQRDPAEGFRVEVKAASDQMRTGRARLTVGWCPGRGRAPRQPRAWCGSREAELVPDSAV